MTDAQLNAYKHGLTGQIHILTAEEQTVIPVAEDPDHRAQKPWKKPCSQPNSQRAKEKSTMLRPISHPNSWGRILFFQLPQSTF
jgi:hypothetical protein